MSTAASALNELPAKKPLNSAINNKSQGSESENATTDLSKLGPKATVTVNKVDSVKPSDDKEFMDAGESEFGLSALDNKSRPTSTTTGTSPIINVPSAADNTTTITVSTSANNNPSTKSSISNSSKLSSKLSDIKDSDIPEDELSTSESDNKIIDIDETAAEENNETADKMEDEDEEKSAAELVAAAAAQIANKTLKKTTGTTGVASKTVKTTGKLLASGKQEQIMKKAMLMMNESGRLNVITDEPGPSIVKLNTPANKAQIKLRAFRQNFERQLAEMRRRTPLQIQTLRAELSNIEFAEIGNKNIMAGLLELVDDHELKLLTIEKMLKSGDITLSF